MTASRINITLGTAGHIDHGKTALIKCLTGCDTDFLKEEKERGMSIELGFAPCTISDLEVGIVDVPGHENFIKTMVAGATSIDAVIFVIAADDGVMPQTREHLDILTLLGVSHGIVALTKIDTVSEDRVATVSEQIRQFLTGTFLENAPIAGVSGITGQGFDTFYEALRYMVAQIHPRTTEGVFRLPVEKTFTVKGYGSVVTGVPVSGTAQIGDELVILPQGEKGRVKALQVYSESAETVISGQCGALSVPQWDYKNITRGNVVTLGKYFSPQQWYLCKFQMLAHDKAFLKTGAKIRLHTGTSEVVATVYLMESNMITASEAGIIQIRTDKPIVAAPADRFIIRTLSPANTIGGGTIVESIERRIKRSKPELVAEAKARAEAVSSEIDFLEYCVKTAINGAATQQELSFRAKLLPEQVDQFLNKLADAGRVIPMPGKLFMHAKTAEKLGNDLVEVIRNFHKEHPESPGIKPDDLLRATNLQKKVFDGLVQLLLSQQKIAERKSSYALPDHREDFDDGQQQLINTIEAVFTENLFNPPKIDVLHEHVTASVQDIQKTLRILQEQKILVFVDRNLLFHKNAIEEATKRVTEHIQAEGMLESVKFKYLLDTTRKYAIPLLDYMDKIGVTIRSGNTRYLKQR